MSWKRGDHVEVKLGAMIVFHDGAKQAANAGLAGHQGFVIETLKRAGKGYVSVRIDALNGCRTAYPVYWDVEEGGLQAVDVISYLASLA